MSIEKYYIESAKFKEYVDRYCTKHGVKPEEALKHRLVIEVFRDYAIEDYLRNSEGALRYGHSCGNN